MASLKEEYKINTQRLQKFEQQYKDDFHKEFRKTAQKYENFLSEILNAQAFLLDSLLWKEAKISKPIQKHLQGLSIDIEFNTKEYLKYFLNTLDETKTNENTKELFTLYEHLKEIQKEYILIISSSSQDAMEYQYSMKELEKDYKIKSFVDELLALKWSMKNNVKLIIIDEYLSITTAKKFLDAYHTHILSKPKIIIIGEHQELHTKAFSVHKILSPAQSQHALLKTAKELLEK
jgi:BMFP domain-containing protein YqiC